MRKFGTDTPQFFSFQIGDSEEVYKIPLSASMTSRDVIAFNEIDGNFFKQVEWLKRFVGDAAYDLTASDSNAIVRAWMEASAEQGAEVGES